MTTCYITIDTEYEVGFTRRHGAASRQDNFNRSIQCLTPQGPVGIGYQMDVLDEHGLKAVFFVDPMPSLLWGTACIEDVVGPIVARGHDVQLHIHTEWLALAGDANPLKSRTGVNIKDFNFDEQCTLLDHARRVLVAAGAPDPVAFRAGNYGANDCTLQALAHLGLKYDTSHCPGIPHPKCDISLSPADHWPQMHHGILEVPAGCIAGMGDQLRHAQVTALSAWEMTAALNHCQSQGIAHFTIVSHSFEMLSPDRARINRFVKARFEKLCRFLASSQACTTGTYAANPPQLADVRTTAQPVLPLNPLRTGLRMAEQMLVNVMYGRW
jgi:hypothetical protein